jgi:hypothetical protein
LEDEDEATPEPRPRRTGPALLLGFLPPADCCCLRGLNIHSKEEDSIFQGWRKIDIREGKTGFDTRNTKFTTYWDLIMSSRGISMLKAAMVARIGFDKKKI